MSNGNDWSKFFKTFQNSIFISIFGIIMKSGFIWVQKSLKLVIFEITVEILWINCRLITAYLLLQVNLDKIMHARWDFDVSSAWTRRVSALDKHQNWSASVLFCVNSRAQNKYAVVNLIHKQCYKQTFLSFICDK